MSTYWHKHPRGFANECDLVRADTPEEAAWLEAHGFERIARRNLARHLEDSAPHDGLSWPAIVVTDPVEAEIRAGYDLFGAWVTIKEREDYERADREMYAALEIDGARAQAEWDAEVARWDRP